MAERLSGFLQQGAQQRCRTLQQFRIAGEQNHAFNARGAHQHPVNRVAMQRSEREAGLRVFRSERQHLGASSLQNLDQRATGQWQFSALVLAEHFPHAERADVDIRFVQDAQRLSRQAAAFAQRQITTWVSSR